MNQRWNAGLRFRSGFKAVLSRAHAWKRTLRDTIVSVSIVEGSGRRGGREMRVLCVGRVGRVPYLTDAILAPEARVHETRRTMLWKVADMLQDDAGFGCDLMLAAVPPWSWTGLWGPESFLVPDWVEGETDLAVFFATPPNRSRAEDLRRVHRHRLRPYVMRKPRDIRGFYDTMHLPYIRRQHGALAEEVPHAEMSRRFLDSDLLLVESESEPIAGIGIDTSGSIPRLFGLGVLEPIDRHLAMSAVGAAYQFSFEYLAAAGHSRVGLGYSRPLIDDGVLQYKRKWGQRLCASYEQSTLLRILRHGPAVHDFLLNTPLIHVTPQGLMGAVFTETGVVPEAFHPKKSATWMVEGLEGVVIHPLNGDPSRRLTPRAPSRADDDLVVRRRVPAIVPRPNSVTEHAPSDPLAIATATFLEQLVGFGAGESMVACVDESTDDDLRNAIRIGVEARGGRFHVVATSLEQPLLSAAGAIVDRVRCHSDGVVCELGNRTHYLTSAWEESIALGARVYSLAQLDAAAFVRCVAGVDHSAMLHFGAILHRILRRGRRVVIRTDCGTVLSMHTRQDRWHRVMRRVTRRRGAWTWQPTGMLTEGTTSSFLGGQISFRPELDSLHGVAVCDGFLWPPRQGGRLDRPVTWGFCRGALVSMQAPPVLGATLGRHLGVGPTFLEHVSIGFHPRATLAGGLHEAERVSGALVMGVGQGVHHADGVMMDVTIEVDGETLLDRGQFVHSSLPGLDPADKQ